MGAWGTGIYSNDTSSDVRDMAKEIYPFTGAEEGTRLILKEFPDTAYSDIPDSDYADFWFALADMQWKYGILTPDVKAKAIRLIDARVGIDEWEGSHTDVKKRIAVMDELKKRLNTPDPNGKIPKPKLKKPCHKPGDIVIIRTLPKEHEASDRWEISFWHEAYIYTDSVTRLLEEHPAEHYEAHGKFFAILCVGCTSVPHSPYLEDVFDEYSTYAVYDYIGDEPPTLDKLKTCGFLPHHLMYTEDNGLSVGTNGWTYRFYLYSHSFRLTKHSFEVSYERINCPDEAIRFCELLSWKNYLDEILLEVTLDGVFYNFFSEKVRLSHAGVKYDDLLSPQGANPPLRPSEELARMMREDLKRQMQNAELP